MKAIVKRRYQEFVEYIEYPMVIYTYETGKIIASNTYAKDMIGYECKNMNFVWDNNVKMKLPKDILDGGSEIYFNRTINSGKEKIEIDIEVNSIVLDNAHILICFFEQSYKQHHMKHLSDMVPRIIWKDKRLMYLGTNCYFRKDVNVSGNNSSDIDIFESQTIERLTEEEKSIMVSQESQYNVIHQFVRKDGFSYFVKMHRMPIINKNGTSVGILNIYNLILNREEYKRVLDYTLRENDILNEAINRSDKIVLSCSLDNDWAVEYVSSNFKNYGYQLNQFFTGKLTWKDVMHPEDYERIRKEDLRSIYVGNGYLVQEYRILTADGKSIWVTDETISIVRNGQSLYRECIITEMGIRKQNMFGHYSAGSYRDYLTLLPNRLKFESDIVDAVESTVQNNSYGYLISFDLDDFKNINDGLGHEYGDILLKNVARFLNGIPQLKDSCYRVGGDEFLIILRDKYVEEADQIISMLFEMFRKPWRLYGKEYYCTMSMGITRFPTDSVNAAELFRFADLAQVEAKKNGKNRVSYFEPKGERKSIERINMEKYLRKAITSDCFEFEVFYQPIVDSKDKTVTGGEALLRWRSPELGFINPVDFLPLSEYLGLIVPLGEYVLREAFEMCKHINDKTDSTFAMNINLSVVQLIQPNIVERIMEIARNVNVRYSNIIFEVTESLAIEDMVLMKTVLNELKEHGFRIALDDFGIGYSSLNHVMEIPLDFIKIDKSFISSYGTKQFNPGLLSAITELAHSMNVEVVVEGVETKQQMEFLMFLSADKYQGFFYGKPVSKDEFFVNFLSNKKGGKK